MKSRLARHQRKALTRQAMVFLLMAMGLVWLVISWGVPALARLAIFLGDLKTSSEKVESTDTIAPIAPRLVTLPEATFSASIAVGGFAEAGTLVTVYVNETKLGEIVVDNQGGFVTDKVDLTAGENRIWAKAEDGAGNVSPDSSVAVVVRDDQTPQLTIRAPADQAVTSETTIEVKGEVSESEADIRVNGRFVAANSRGEFSVKVGLNPGDNLITVTATDQAGNKAETSLTVKRQ